MYVDQVTCMLNLSISLFVSYHHCLVTFTTQIFSIASFLFVMPSTHKAAVTASSSRRSKGNSVQTLTSVKFFKLTYHLASSSYKGIKGKDNVLDKEEQKMFE